MKLRIVICPACDGEGMVEGKVCPECAGDGEIELDVASNPPMTAWAMENVE